MPILVADGLFCQCSLPGTALGWLVELSSEKGRSVLKLADAFSVRFRRL